MKRIAIILSFTCLAFAVSTVQAQMNPTTAYNPHFATGASQTFPSLLGEGYKRVEIMLPSIHPFLGNNAMSYGRFQEYSTGDPISDQLIEMTINDLNETNRLSLGATVQALSVAFTVGSPEKQQIHFGLSATDRIAGNIAFTKDLFSLLYKGNAQFAGETANIGPIEANALYHREFSFGVSAPIRLDSEKRKLTIKPGVRLRYILPIGGVFTEAGEGSLFTEQDGRYLDLDYNFAFHTAIPDDIQKVLGGMGKGFGADVGVSMWLNDFITASVAVNDIGRVTFDEGTKNYSGASSYHYDGIEVDILELSSGVPLQFDSLLEIFEVTEDSVPFQMNLGARISLMGGVTLGPKLTKKKGEPYFQHIIMVSYVQGLDDHLASTIRPQFGIGYTYSLNNVLNLGANFTFLGHNKVALGPNISVNAGFFKFGVGSSNIMPFLSAKAGTGVDLSMQLGLSF